MDIKRILFWVSFFIVLGLIVWGLVVAMNKPGTDGTSGTPAEVTSSDNVRGPENAPVTLIEYSDYQCPACRSYYPIIEQLLAESSTTVRFVYRHFPLGQHKNATLAAAAAEAAGKQDAYWAMGTTLFENQDSWASLPAIQAREIFVGYADRLGLDKEIFASDMDLSEIKDKIRSQTQEGISIGVNSTPSFFLNGKRINNPQSYEAFKKVIDDAVATSTP